MVAYISRLNFPDPAANSLQTIRMADALAQLSEPTWLFVHDLSAPEAEIRREYGIDRSSLKFWSLRTRRWPNLVYHHAMLRFLTYNTGVAAILSGHPFWRNLPRQHKRLYVRSRLEILYWGLLRPYLRWMRDWQFVCEIHDLLRVEEGEESEGNGRSWRMIQALRNYDLVIAVNQALAEDMRRQTQDAVRAQVAPLCSGLSRLPHPPTATLPEDRVIIGYFGTIDLAHGIDAAIQALDFLPRRFVLRLTGRVREDARPWVDAGVQSGRVELRGRVPYAQVAEELDACHLALVPAGRTVHATRYRSPLKIFDAMLRGKAILAADVPCHRELLCDDESAVFYRNGDPQDLAAKVLHLAAYPLQMERIARAAWEASSAFTYPARAQTLLALMDEARSQPRWEKVVYA